MYCKHDRLFIGSPFDLLGWVLLLSAVPLQYGDIESPTWQWKSERELRSVQCTQLNANPNSHFRSRECSRLRVPRGERLRAVRNLHTRRHSMEGPTPEAAPGRHLLQQVHGTGVGILISYILTTEVTK